MVFGAGIDGYGPQAKPDKEAVYSLSKALEIQQKYHAPIIAFANYSEKHQVMYHKIMKSWIQANGGVIANSNSQDISLSFNTVGEAQALWRYCDRIGECPPKRVYAVARGVHIRRAVDLLWRTCPPQWLTGVEIKACRATSKDRLLWLHELFARRHWSKQPVERVIPYPAQR